MATRETRDRPAATVQRLSPAFRMPAQAAANRAVQRAEPMPAPRVRAARTPGLIDAMKRRMREGRDAALADAKTAAQEIRDRPPRSCRVHGERYPGCPLDLLGF